VEEIISHGYAVLTIQHGILSGTIREIMEDKHGDEKQ
jgi:hypothetical protein